MSVVTTPSPFHIGEQQIQARLGVRERLEKQGRRMIRDHLPDQHREFYPQLPILLVGSADAAGRPWASMLAGRPGFVRAPDPHTLEIRGGSVHGDPFAETRRAGAAVGVLGIELHSRRRNRLTGRIRTADENLTTIDVDQTFGNCPQYIQAREFSLLPAIDTIGEARPLQRLQAFDARSLQMISAADTFYIATHAACHGSDRSFGADVSHRGGRPGFVRIDDERTLTWPDFRGNSHFNTLGNIALNPLAGLLFVDHADGTLLALTGAAEIVWDEAQFSGFAGAQRLVRFVLDEARRIDRAIPIRWRFVGASPVLRKTGTWREAVAMPGER